MSDIPATGPERDAYNAKVAAANAWFDDAAARGTCPICGRPLKVQKARDIMSPLAARMIGADLPVYSCNGPGAPPSWTGLAEYHKATGNHFAFIGGP